MMNRGMAWSHIYDEPKLVQEIYLSDADIFEYVSITLRHMVDDVILYNERLKTG
jgi:hypothetical protein